MRETQLPAPTGLGGDVQLGGGAAVGTVGLPATVEAGGGAVGLAAAVVALSAAAEGGSGGAAAAVPAAALVQVVTLSTGSH